MHKLKADVVTSWGSCYDMVERVLEQLEAIRMMLCDDRSSSHLIPSWQDCDALESIAVALKPLKVMTDALSGEHCVTISAVIPLLNYIYDTWSMILATQKWLKEWVTEDLKMKYTEKTAYSVHFLRIFVCLLV